MPDLMLPVFRGLFLGTSVRRILFLREFSRLGNEIISYSLFPKPKLVNFVLIELPLRECFRGYLWLAITKQTIIRSSILSSRMGVAGGFIDSYVGGQTTH